ncbi:hypothetical protein [Micromonospora cathayae]|uniref:Alpha/beta hydrolase family protein n=1 Tax=Micromonospora cathayae TaxID=3028804 RepID=A0ABY7ZPR7_9ACTN|nr:hypothetical protein [Micromonospora sp. HUAS 3]WDZ84853.1 hypothetical protein PVK37_31340 [Micromonospora sp. HUAS 3]
MERTFVLLSSPFLGPAAWDPVASVLTARGYDVVVPSLPQDPLFSPEEVLRALENSVPGLGELILVPHSNAGLYVPALVASRPVRATVFLDAVLPPENGRRPVAPAGLIAKLRDRVGADGLLPLWCEWWPEEDLAALFPDPQTRRRVEADQRRVPWDYLTAEVEVPAGWATNPAGYVAFGGTYADELREATARGWPVRILDGRHLHMLWDPAAVASTLVEITDELTQR